MVEGKGVSNIYKSLFCAFYLLSRKRNVGSNQDDMVNATIIFSFVLSLNTITFPVLGVCLGFDVSRWYTNPNAKLTAACVSIFILILNFYFVYFKFGEKNLKNICSDLSDEKVAWLIKWGSRYLGVSVLLPIFLAVFFLFS